MKLFDLPGSVKDDALHMLCGEHLGGGIGREVYVCALIPDLVVKFEPHAKSFQNVAEWNTWLNLRETPAARWLAPLYQISPCGTVLLQKRTSPLPLSQKSVRVPHWMWDVKRANFGLLDGRVVAHDFGTMWRAVAPCFYKKKPRLKAIDIDDPLAPDNYVGTL